MPNMQQPQRVQGSQPSPLRLNNLSLISHTDSPLSTRSVRFNHDSSARSGLSRFNDSARSAKSELSHVLYAYIDHAAKWESLPLAEDAGEGDAPSLLEKEEDEDRVPWYKNPTKLLKMLVPHIALIVILLAYTALGAYVLQQIEGQVELNERIEKVRKIQLLYEQVINETWYLRGQGLTRPQWDEQVQARLRNISAAHEGGLYDADVESLQSRWTFPSAVLYALTLLTTCGYDQVSPLTNGGKIFAVAFALVGIPLMFITAADIGKFLSDTTLRGWKRLKQAVWFIKAKTYECAGRPIPTSRKPSAASSGSRKLEEMGLIEEGEMETSEGLWFPIGAYISLICLYCALGGWLYTTWEPDFDFIHAFQFSFNLITTVGLGGIIVKNGFYLVLVVIYIIIGLAVVTMCVDLASTHLKAYFTKIHYFGRARSRFLGMSEDIREMMAIIGAMRKKKGGKVTWDDVQRYMALEQRLALRPYVPRHVHLWRYIDETSSIVSTMRQNSFQSDMLCSSLTSLRPARASIVLKNDLANQTHSINIPQLDKEKI